MQTSIFLARLLGPMLVVFGLAFAIHPKIYTAMAQEFIKSRALVYLAGAFALTGGLALVLTHNVWAADWRVIITILGWMAAIAGVLRLLLPDMVRRVGGGMFISERPVFITGAIWAAIGLFLCYSGYLR
jgi:uncharacterized membrane protein